MTTEQAWNEYGLWLDGWQAQHNPDGEFDGLSPLDMTFVFGADTSHGVAAGLRLARASAAVSEERP